MKKLSFALALLVFTMLTLVACGGSGSSSSAAAREPAPSSTPVASTPAPESSETASLPQAENTAGADSKPAASAPTGDLSDDIYSRQIQINGVVYTYPVENVGVFLDNGWTCTKDLDFSLPKRTSTGGYGITNSEGHRFTITFYNPSEQTLDITECPIDTFSISKSGIETGIEALLPGGFTIGDNLEDILAAYGEPDERKDNDTYTTLTYGERHDCIKLQFRVDTQLLNDINYTFDR